MNNAAYGFRLRNPDPFLERVEWPDHALYYHEVSIRIDFCIDSTKVGTIIFDGDEYRIPDSITKNIVEKHMPEIERKTADHARKVVIEREKQEDVFKERLIEQRSVTSLSGVYSCLYCGGAPVSGNICP